MRDSYGAPGVGQWPPAAGPGAWPYGGPPGLGRPASPPPPRRRTGVVVAVVASIVVAVLVMAGVAVGAVRAVRDHDTARPSASANLPTVPSQPDPALFAPKRAAVTEMFAAREAALVHGDQQAWLATVDPQQPAVVRSETTLFTNLRQLPLLSYAWSYDSMTQVSGYPVPDSTKSTLGQPQDVYSPGMTVTYRLRGFDTEPSSDAYVPLLVERSGHWYVAGDRTSSATFEDAYDEPWTAGPVKVQVTTHSLVIVSPKDAGRLPALAGQADAAVAAVTAMWPKGWSHMVVVYATRDPDVFASFLGRNRVVSEVSALTLGVGATALSPQDVRVVVNTAQAPPGDSYLPVLLRHEFTHVAQWNTQASGTPRWVIEGIAQYTAYRHHLSRARVSRAIVDDARAHRWPAHMPASDTFYGADPAQAFHYDMSWLAWEYVAEKYGDSKVKALYARLSAITGTVGSPAALKAEAAAFPPLLHMSETAFVNAVEAWTARSFRPA